MIHLRKEKCLEMKLARQRAGLSQSELAEEVGCKQSAISMFERGDPTKLSDGVVDKIARKFEISLEEPPTIQIQNRVSVVSAADERGYCPNPECPSNIRYRAGDQVFLEPNRALADPVGGKFCAKCGEILEKRCPNCGASLHDGAVCSFCGKPYVAV